MFGQFTLHTNWVIYDDNTYGYELFFQGPNHTIDIDLTYKDGFDSRRRHIFKDFVSSYFFFNKCSFEYLFFYIKTPRLRRASAHLRPGSSIHLGLTLYYHIKYTLNVTTKCPLHGTTHTVRPYMYPSMVHPIRTNHFQMLYHTPDTSCLTLLMVSGGNTCWDNIPTLSPPMYHTVRPTASTSLTYPYLLFLVAPLTEH